MALDKHRLRRLLIERTNRVAQAATPSDWDTMRADYEHEMAKTTPVEGVEISRVRVGQTHAEWLEPTQPVERALLFLHGGGYTIGSTATHRALAARIAIDAHAAVLLPAYRLAPEHPYPAALDDALASWQWLVDKQAVSATSIGIVGDSAGGGLAAALTHRLLHEHQVVPGAQVLLSPWVDLTMTADVAPASTAVRESKDPMVTDEFLRSSRSAYVPDGRYERADVSPVLGRWTGGPPTLIQVGSSELLVGGARSLFHALLDAGVEARLEEWDDMVHVWQQFAPSLQEGTEAIGRIGTFLRDSIRPAELVR